MLALFVSARTCLRNSISDQSIAATPTAVASFEKQVLISGGSWDQLLVFCWSNAAQKAQKPRYIIKIPPDLERAAAPDLHLEPGNTSAGLWAVCEGGTPVVALAAVRPSPYATPCSKARAARHNPASSDFLRVYSTRSLIVDKADNQAKPGTRDAPQ
jgi:hypothetical protein